MTRIAPDRPADDDDGVLGAILDAIGAVLLLPFPIPDEPVLREEPGWILTDRGVAM